MDYADGGDLSSCLSRRKGRLLEEEVILDWCVVQAMKSCLVGLRLPVAVEAPPFVGNIFLELTRRKVSHAAV